jgi:cell shape-determining protein MreC
MELPVTDQEIEFFKKDVGDYNDIDTQIKELKKKMKPYQDKIKELAQKKKQKQEEVLSFMSSNNLDVCHVGDDSKLELKNTSVSKPITKGDVYDRIYKYFSEETEKTDDMNNQEKSKFLHDYIYIEGREKVPMQKLVSK